MLVASPILRSEKVTLNVKKNFAVTVNVEFHFENTSYFNEALVFPKNSTISYKNFRAYWNDIELECTPLNPPDGEYFTLANELYSSMIAFKVINDKTSKSTHVIVYEYDSPYWNNYKYDDRKGFYLEYILKTGSLWGKTLRDLSIFVYFEEPLCLYMEPLTPTYPGKCLNDYLWEFKGKNISLDKDLRLLIQSSTINNKSISKIR
ncbi:hypothetical protein [Leptospira alstonii]|uniref:hypothetical protein n=1 Tax=Leptospira alstonii TaxID=28452 RepID=UPI000773904C|nr:hypothetical protein [Leptospira alstonii]